MWHKNSGCRGGGFETELPENCVLVKTNKDQCMDRIEKSGNLSIPPTNILKNLGYFLGLVHYISKFIQNLAKFCHPTTSTIAKICYFIWTKNYAKHFNEIRVALINESHLYQTL